MISAQPGARPSQDPSRRSRLPEQRQDQGQKQGVDEQVGDEPEMVPGRHVEAVAVAAEAWIGGKIAAPEGEIGIGIGDLLDHLVIALRRHDHEHGEDERDEQPQGALPGQAAGGHLVGHEPGRRAGDEEKQGQPPGTGEQHQGLEGVAGMIALHVPVPGHVEHADMVEDQEAEGGDAQPVEVDQSGGGGSGIRHSGLLQRACLHLSPGCPADRNRVGTSGRYAVTIGSRP